MNETLHSPILTLPDAVASPLTVRAKALLFHDPRSVELLEDVERIARSDASVLVIGETGTGKELIARHLHTRSRRRGPFLAVNCGAFSETLIDAELFGHESGAFTGAQSARAGWFEAANGGTLFLDEIGDLPLALQVKLLRVLQERQIVRLGSRKSTPLDVRLVAATNIDLRRAVEAQRFRADLYYRLSVATVTLPPLRDRPGDVLPLAQHFIGLYANRLGLHDAALDPPAEAALLDYPWPGNIRELENVIHFALIVCRDGIIRERDLKLLAPRTAPASTIGLPVDGADAPDAVPPAASEDGTRRRLREVFETLLDEAPPDLHRTVEAALLRAAFARTRENQVHAARILGLSRNTFRTLLKRHGMLGDAASASRDDADVEADDEPTAEA